MWSYVLCLSADDNRSVSFLIIGIRRSYTSMSLSVVDVITTDQIDCQNTHIKYRERLVNDRSIC